MASPADSVTGAAPGQPLWRDRSFTTFWAAQTLSAVGDSFAAVAVPLLVLQATGSVALMGLLTGAGGVAAVVAGIGAGVVADRVDRQRLLIWCDLTRMLLYGAIPVAWALGRPVWLLFVVLPVCEAVGMVFEVTCVTVVRALAGAGQVTQANSRLYATAAAAGVLGPLLAGVVAGAFGPAAAIGADAASFALSAVGSYVVRLRPADGTGSRSRTSTGWRDMLAGAEFLWRHPVLRTLAVLLTLYIFLTYGLTNVLIYDLQHVLRQSYATVGVVLAVAAAGPVAGSALAAPLRRLIGFGACWIGSVAAGGIAVGFLGATSAVPGIAALAAAYLGCGAAGGICSMSLRQQVTPDHLLGRVTSAFWTVHFSLGPAGAALLAWAAGRYGVAPVFAASGGGCLLIAIAAVFTQVRQPAPELSSSQA